MPGVNRPEKVIVGISGGVDSAVAALCLLREGHDVEGLHMTNWDADDEYCSAAADYQEARRACAALGIPLHRVSFASEYREEVFAGFLREYAAGRTPNPDVLCNRQIKFGHFLRYAERLGADRIATGHYARIGTAPMRLLRGADPAKDQSYFLHAVDPKVLARVSFPVGALKKDAVRRIATEAGLPNHARRDSTGICFIGERPFRAFLARFLTGSPGPMETPEGRRLGEHAGLMHYTPGQRHGLGIGGRRDGAAEAWYVAGKDLERNALIVVQGRAHPALWSTVVQASALHWLGGEPPAYQAAGELRCTARIRHRQPDSPCTVTRLGADRCEVRFEQPQWAVAPGQYVVFYDSDVCLGGGVVEQAGGLERLRQRSYGPGHATALPL
jgi:tRNA-specific 2-thiouridylase